MLKKLLKLESELDGFIKDREQIFIITPARLNKIQGDLRRIVAEVTKEIVEQKVILAQQRIEKWKKSHSFTSVKKS